MLRSYEHVLGSLPSADAWADDHARKGYSSASLSGLVSTAITGLQSLDPSARFVPCEPSGSQQSSGGSPSLASAYQMPIIRTKRVSPVQIGHSLISVNYLIIIAASYSKVPQL